MVDRTAPRHEVCLFIGDLTGDDGERRPTDEAVPLGRTRNLSLSGVFLVTDARPPLQSMMAISFVWGEDGFASRVRVVRHAEDGIGLEFVDPDKRFIQALREVTGEEPS